MKKIAIILGICITLISCQTTLDDKQIILKRSELTIIYNMDGHDGQSSSSDAFWFICENNEHELYAVKIRGEKIIRYLKLSKFKMAE
jgi:hypothetical protein